MRDGINRVDETLGSGFDKFTRGIRSYSMSYRNAEKHRRIVELIQIYFPQGKGWRRDWARTKSAEIAHLSITAFKGFDFVDIYIYNYFEGRFGCVITSMAEGTRGFSANEPNLKFDELKLVIKQFFKETTEQKDV